MARQLFFPLAAPASGGRVSLGLLQSYAGQPCSAEAAQLARATFYG